jgi:hypothetical protein
MPNNRQWAIFIWLVVAGVVVLFWRTGRRVLKDLSSIALSRTLLVPFALLVAWVVGEVSVARALGAWDGTLVTDTIVWFVATGLVLMFRHTEALKRPDFFKRAARGVLGTSVLIQGYSELAVFGLGVELAIQPIAAFIGLMLGVSPSDEKFRQLRSLLASCLGLGGLALLAAVTIKLATSWGDLDHAYLARQLVLPAWLTLGALPFIYCIALYSAYQSAFLWTGWRDESGWRKRQMRRLALVTSLNVRVHDAGQFVHPWPTRLQDADSFKEARSVLKAFSDSRR